MKVLLISDSGLNVNSGGFQQTLYNIFFFLPPQNLLLVTTSQAIKTAPVSEPFDQQVLTCNIRFIPFQHNRFGRFLNGAITWLNCSLNTVIKRFKKIRHAIQKFDADVVVVAPNGADGIFIYHLLKKSFSNKKVFPYFMDDWLYQSKLKWPGGNIHFLAANLLANNKQWLMISESLGNILAERYTTQPERTLIIHNPVNTKGTIPPELVKQKNRYTIAYAGSLWPMHFDAFLVIAKALLLMQDKIRVKLIVYTSASNWAWRKDELQVAGVEYGGYLPYTAIHATLAKADCFLLTSSFTKEWQTHSKGSVQTKITDYLKAGRLIISCGPAYSANHYFLKKHKCGICIETNDAEKAAAALENIFEHIELNQAFVQNGCEVLENEFNFEVVHKKLKQFLDA